MFCTGLAVVVDAITIYLGFMLAVWLRFFSGWIPLREEVPPLSLYIQGAGLATLLFLFIFGALGLYQRPQTGPFGNTLPRLIRAILWGIGLAMILAFALRTEPPFSRLVTGLAFFTVLLLVSIARFILFLLEIHWARRRSIQNRITILGTGRNAARLRQEIEDDPRLRAEVIGFFKLDATETPVPGIEPGLVLGTLDDLRAHIEAGATNHLILSAMNIPHETLVAIILQCERALIEFQLVPDLFRILTSRVKVQTVGGVPLLGMGRWPLDHAGNRLLKRLEDVSGALLGLLVTGPLLALLAWRVKHSSPGPVFYRQERCGENGRPFILYKLRTMPVDAERETGPVWAQPDDPRRTPIGAFMRQYNLDELPQFWNVLKGDMSLVGPRPERPHFVDQFKEDIGRYMWRHIYKPGMTGWAQVNGLRGNTSIEERINHDLYYLENWSLAFDCKILIKTFFSRQNAY